MKCPTCGNEMEKGFVQAFRRMAWVKQQHKVSLFPKNGEVLLGNNAFSDIIIDSYICKSCKKIVMDYRQADYKEK